VSVPVKCPYCGNTNITTTLKGIISGPDTNRVSCHKCGNSGLAYQWNYILNDGPKIVFRKDLLKPDHASRDHALGGAVRDAGAEVDPARPQAPPTDGGDHHDAATAPVDGSSNQGGEAPPGHTFDPRAGVWIYGYDRTVRPGGEGHVSYASMLEPVDPNLVETYYVSCNDPQRERMLVWYWRFIAFCLGVIAGAIWHNL
jgi:predicted nucleic-acid-binding Zn-ribbon protein